MIGKTRLAPTPSGYLHQGNLFSFALTWLMARKDGLEILLRIDDMDRNRYRRSYLEDIFLSLEALGIDYDEGPQAVDDFEKNWSQLKRMDLYHEALNEIRLKGDLFACSCSRKEILRLNPDGLYPGTCRSKGLSLDEDSHAWRWQHCNLELSLKNWMGEKDTFPYPLEMQHLVLRTKSAKPAYQICSLIDDLHFKVSHIVRGQDLWHSSLVQIALAQKYQWSNFPMVNFHHHPLLLNGEKQKISKSQAAPAAEVYRNEAARMSLLNELAQHLNLPLGAQNLSELLNLYRVA
ncbi:MAG: glutamate--tRNA ligase family protein [Bacteroidetes bacterium]|nr:glutamate--tRNA ligase family protein [Bacteroidota bacterium]